MKRIRRLKIRMTTTRRIVVERATETQDDDLLATNPQRCPLCGQLIEPDHTINLLPAYAEEEATANDEL